MLPCCGRDSKSAPAVEACSFTHEACCVYSEAALKEAVARFLLSDPRTELKLDQGIPITLLVESDDAARKASIG